MSQPVEEKLDQIRREVGEIRTLLAGTLDNPGKGLVAQVQINRIEIDRLRERMDERKKREDRWMWACIAAFISAIAHALVSWVRGQP